jgi:acetyltransferase-like isoleucine patch superfamily enzyme
MTPHEAKNYTIGKSPVSIGRFTYGVDNISIRQWNEGAALSIGAFCSIAASTTIFLGGNHRVDWATTFPFGHIFQNEFGGETIKGHPSTKGDVTIGNDVWIGSGVTIMSGVQVGDGAVLSANAHVVKDVLPYDVVGGNPATVIKKRFSDEIKELLLTLRWWELPVTAIKEIAADLSSPPSKELLRSLIAQYRNS